jgi:hypothetical protein
MSKEIVGGVVLERKTLLAGLYLARSEGVIKCQNLKRIGEVGEEGGVISESGCEEEGNVDEWA